MNISSEILEEARHGDLSRLRRVPKADLHAHCSLSAPFRTLQEISGFQIPTPPKRFNGFGEFHRYLEKNFFHLMESEQNGWRILRDCLDWMISDGVVYTECSFDLYNAVEFGISWDSFADTLREELERVSGQITVCCELGIGRDTDDDFWKPELGKALATGVFGSVDLYGKYEARQVEELLPIFDKSREAGLKIKLHTGEFPGSERVRKDVELTQPDGIQHGIAAAEDETLLAYLASLQCEVNVCPGSNIGLGAASSYEDHPIRKMFDAGVKVTLATDDYAIFGVSLSEEYLNLYRAGVFNADELERIRQNGLDAFEHYTRKS